MATAGQLFQWQLHKDACQTNLIGQATLKHKTLQGQLDAGGPTGNQIYTGPGPVTADPPTTNTLIWLVFQPQRSQTQAGADPLPGRTNIPRDLAQFPVVDDSGNVITVAHDDWIDDVSGTRYRVENPTIDQGNTFWTVQLLRQR